MNKPSQWIASIVAVFLLGLAVVWYFNQNGKPLGDTLLNGQALTFQASELKTLRDLTFTEPLKQHWKEHVFKNPSSYQAEDNVLHASSQASSSMLYREVNLDLSQRPILTWEWKAVQFPGNKKGKRLASKSDNDFSGRVYILFKGKNPLAAELIQYVWDDHFPEGTTDDSPFLKNVKILVVQSGPSNEWVSEMRDVYADYRKLFGRRPPQSLTAVGVMSDSDNTKTQSEIYFRNLSIKKSKTLPL